MSALLSPILIKQQIGQQNTGTKKEKDVSSMTNDDIVYTVENTTKRLLNSNSKPKVIRDETGHRFDSHYNIKPHGATH